jgi:SAM-dependent methyltransferase
MTTVDEHYERLLAKHYTWMFNTSFAEKVEEQKSILSQALKPVIGTTTPSLAVDLGSGPGFQTIALAQLGFAPVVAVDTSAELLDELRSHAGGLSIQIRQADLRDLPVIVAAGEAAAVVCMGDTLTHLPSKPDVRGLFAAVSRSLVSGGVFVITYRDLTAELKGAERFIPVRADENTIMTCFLEYEDPEYVTVHDLVHTRENKSWVLSKSSYRKLRLGVGWLIQELLASGFVIQSQGPSGRLFQIVAGRP